MSGYYGNFDNLMNMNVGFTFDPNLFNPPPPPPPVVAPVAPTPTPSQTPSTPAPSQTPSAPAPVAPPPVPTPLDIGETPSAPSAPTAKAPSLLDRAIDFFSREPRTKFNDSRENDPLINKAETKTSNPYLATDMGRSDSQTNVTVTEFLKANNSGMILGGSGLLVGGLLAEKAFLTTIGGGLLGIGMLGLLIGSQPAKKPEENLIDPYGYGLP